MRINLIHINHQIQTCLPPVGYRCTPSLAKCALEKALRVSLTITSLHLVNSHFIMGLDIVGIDAEGTVESNEPVGTPS